MPESILEEDVNSYCRKNLLDLTTKVYSYLTPEWRNELRNKLNEMGYKKVTDLKVEDFMQWCYELALIRCKAAKQAEEIMRKSVEKLR